MKGCTACTMCLEDVSPAAQTPSVGVLALDQALEREWALAKASLYRRLSPSE